MKALIYIPQPDLAGHVEVHEISNEIINFVGKIVEYDRIHNLIGRLICYDRGNLSNQYIIIDELDKLLKGCDILIIVFTNYYFKTFRSIAVIDTTRNVKARGDFNGEVIETEHFIIEYSMYGIFRIIEKEIEEKKEKEEEKHVESRVKPCRVFELFGHRVEEYNINENKIYLVRDVSSEHEKLIVYTLMKLNGLEPSREEKIGYVTVLRWRPRTVAYSKEDNNLCLIIFRKYVSKRSLPNLFKILEISF